MLPPVTLQSSDFQESASAPSRCMQQSSTVFFVISVCAALSCLSQPALLGACQDRTTLVSNYIISLDISCLAAGQVWGVRA